MRLLLLLLSLSAMVSTSAVADDNGPRLLVHLLDYLAKDYGGAVAGGRVSVPSEYAEQVEFSNLAVKTAAALPDSQPAASLCGRLARLQTLIADKADASAVAGLARDIQAQAVRASGLEVSPGRWPDRSNGGALFASECAACHGTTGHGDGPAGGGLVPKPADFLSEERMGDVSPFQAFNTVRLGVPGTAMPPFPSLSDKEVWDLAFYVVSLRTDGRAADAGPRGEFSPDAETLHRAAVLSDRSLLRSLGGERGRAALAALRQYSGTDAAGSSLSLTRASLAGVVELYRAGDAKAAKSEAVKAYLEGVEPVEPRLMANDPAVVAELETRMGAVRSAVESQAPQGDVEAAVAAAVAAVGQAEGLLVGRQVAPWLVFASSSGILLREGFEAVLVILALLGVLRAAGNGRAAAFVHGGWVLALALGGVAWVCSGWVMQLSGAGRELMEGASSLFAVVVLLLAGFWLHSQTEIGRWKACINGRVQAALSGKNLVGLAAVSFVAVFREAFETVLFLRALSLESGGAAGAAMAVGVFGTLAFVLALTWLALRYSVRLPVKQLFTASALLMLVVAAILAGKGLHALQETGLLSASASPFHLRWDLVGLYPTFQAQLCQAATVVLGFLLWQVGKRPSSLTAAAPKQAGPLTS